MFLKGLTLALALLASFSLGAESGEKANEPTEEQKLEIQTRRNNLEPSFFEDGSERGAMNEDDSGQRCYCLYVETDDERQWSATDEDWTDTDGDGVYESRVLHGYAVARYYPPEGTHILAFDGKLWDEDPDNIMQVTTTDGDGNIHTHYGVFTTVGQVESVLRAVGDENPVLTMVQMEILNPSYLQIPQAR